MTIGDQAPDFELPLENGERFRLSDFRAKKNVVLYFYPRDFTWGCTKEGCTFSSHFAEIVKLNAVIVGISSDSVELHRTFSAQYHFPFPLASDEEMVVCRLYDAERIWGKAARRMTYVVDRNGIIRGKAQFEILIDRHWEYVAKILRELNTDEAMGQHPLKHPSP